MMSVCTIALSCRPSNFLPPSFLTPTALPPPMTTCSPTEGPGLLAAMAEGFCEHLREEHLSDLPGAPQVRLEPQGRPG